MIIMPGAMPYAKGLILLSVRQFGQAIRCLNFQRGHGGSETTAGTALALET